MRLVETRNSDPRPNPKAAFFAVTLCASLEK